MQFSRYKSFWLNFYQSLENSNRSLNLLITGKTSYHNSSSRLIRVSTGLDQFISGSILFPTGLTFQCLFYLYQASSLLFSFLIWRPPALPHRLQCSTIGRLRLNRRVRDGNGCFPQAHRHQKSGLTFQCLFYLYQASSLLFSFLIWRPPALPHRLQCSTIGRLRLNRRVRDGNGCFPQAHRHQK